VKQPVIVRDYETMVAVLAEFRRIQGVSLRRIAEQADCSPATLSENLRNLHRMDALTLIQTARALGYDLALIPREDAP
jgi:transcriptional regulator with XRE-family HTH domain